MNPELQTVVDRLELVERQNRSLRFTGVLALLLALGALAALASERFAPPPPAVARARFSVVEANRFLLRDLGGEIAGGLEVESAGTIKLVLGGAKGKGAAFMQVEPTGMPSLTLRGTDGTVRAALIGAATPSLALAPEGQRSTAQLVTREDGSGALVLADSHGKVRIQRP